MKNDQREVKLQALDLPDGKAVTVVKGITEYKDDCSGHYECEHWKKE